MKEKLAMAVVVPLAILFGLSFGAVMAVFWAAAVYANFVKGFVRSAMECARRGLRKRESKEREGPDYRIHKAFTATSTSAKRQPWDGSFCRRGRWMN